MPSLLGSRSGTPDLNRLFQADRFFAPALDPLFLSVNTNVQYGSVARRDAYA
jgi:hypothetical protein